jgi:FtsZ-binding cell division protein ZapB
MVSSHTPETAMYTIASLKAEHKTLAAAKAFHKLKASSWAALVDKLINPPIAKPTIKGLQAQIAELKAENTSLKQQLIAAQNTESENTSLKQQLIAAQNTESDYFVSPEAEIVYSIIKLDGEQRLKALGINKSHFKDSDKAKKWRNDLAMKVHPDKCAHPHAAEAMEEITALFENMVGA